MVQPHRENLSQFVQPSNARFSSFSELRRKNMFLFDVINSHSQYREVKTTLCSFAVSFYYITS